MSEATRWILILGLVMIATANGAAAAKTYPAISGDTSLVVTIHVENDAKVDRRTLTEAEAVATEIFRKLGVEARWIDTWDRQAPKLVDDGSSDLTQLRLSILSQAMSDRFLLANEILGLAPGGGRDRCLAYVFFDRIRKLNDVPAMVWLGGMYLRPSHTLGYAIAHEIGHLLLNMEGHSESGIMRRRWTHLDREGIASGGLSFTPEQAEVIQAEVIRRVRQQHTAEVCQN
jgi:hypothetical protein